MYSHARWNRAEHCQTCAATCQELPRVCLPDLQDLVTCVLQQMAELRGATFQPRLHAGRLVASTLKVSILLLTHWCHHDCCSENVTMRATQTAAQDEL